MDQTMEAWTKAKDDVAATIPDETERDHFYDFHSEEYADRLHFRTILLNSLFSAYFALFEEHLLRICLSAKRQLKSRFSVHDMNSDSATDRAKLYLGTLGVDFPNKTAEWKRITIYRTIRNKIMHAGSEVPQKNKTVVDYATANGIVSGSDSARRFELTSQVCDSASRDFVQFLETLHISFEEKVTEFKKTPRK